MFNKNACFRGMVISLCILKCMEAVCFSADFPNYFLEKELVQKSHQAKQFASHTEYVEDKVEQALFSILERLQVPFVEGENPDGSPKIITQGFFERVEAKVKARDPGARVYIAGGVVRSLLGYIYKKIYNAHQKAPAETTEQVLDRIIHGVKRKGGPKKEILSLSALGIGSDLDILIELSPTVSGQENQQDAIQQEVTALINSAEKFLGLESEKSKVKYAIVPIGDIKDYQSQISRATEQGGSTLDWLAFPLTRASGVHMRLPSSHPDIFKKFLEGELEYLPPSDPSRVKDPDKQTVRGLRALLEIPFLDLSNSGKEQMKKELLVLLEKIKEGSLLSTSAYEQFSKMIRNARFQGAHNRFYPASFHTNTSEANDSVESLVYQFSELSQRNEKRIPLIPEFILNVDPSKRGQTDRCDLAKEQLLMNQDEFTKKYTDQGTLYHGTPSIDNILCVIRNGFIASSENQGAAVRGYGAYATPLSEVACDYGIPISFKLKQNAPLRIIKWSEEIEQSSNMQALKAKAEQEKMSLFKYLGIFCDIDLIVNSHVLIQNSGALILPKNIQDLIGIQSDRVEQVLQKFPDHALETQTITARLVKELEKTVSTYHSFYRLGKILGMQNLKKIPDLFKIYSVLLLKNKSEFVRTAVIESMLKSESFREDKWQKLVLSVLLTELTVSDLKHDRMKKWFQIPFDLVTEENKESLIQGSFAILRDPEFFTEALSEEEVVLIFKPILESKQHSYYKEFIDILMIQLSNEKYFRKKILDSLIKVIKNANPDDFDEQFGHLWSFIICNQFATYDQINSFFLKRLTHSKDQSLHLEVINYFIKVIHSSVDSVYGGPGYSAGVSLLQMSSLSEEMTRTLMPEWFKLLRNTKLTHLHLPIQDIVTHLMAVGDSKVQLDLIQLLHSLAWSVDFVQKSEKNKNQYFNNLLEIKISELQGPVRQALVQEWIEIFKGPFKIYKNQAFSQLVKLHDPAVDLQIVSILEPIILTENLKIPFEVSQNLFELESQSPELNKRLIPLFHKIYENKASTRIKARVIQKLEVMGEQDVGSRQLSIPILLSAINDEDHEVRENAVNELLKINPWDRAVQVTLMSELESKEKLKKSDYLLISGFTEINEENLDRFVKILFIFAKKYSQLVFQYYSDYYPLDVLKLLSDQINKLIDLYPNYFKAKNFEWIQYLREGSISTSLASQILSQTGSLSEVEVNQLMPLLIGHDGGIRESVARLFLQHLDPVSINKVIDYLIRTLSSQSYIHEQFEFPSSMLVRFYDAHPFDLGLLMNLFESANDFAQRKAASTIARIQRIQSDDLQKLIDKIQTHEDQNFKRNQITRLAIAAIPMAALKDPELHAKLWPLMKKSLMNLDVYALDFSWRLQGLIESNDPEVLRALSEHLSQGKKSTVNVLSNLKSTDLETLKQLIIPSIIQYLNKHLITRAERMSVFEYLNQFNSIDIKVLLNEEVIKFLLPLLTQELMNEAFDGTVTVFQVTALRELFIKIHPKDLLSLHSLIKNLSHFKPNVRKLSADLIEKLYPSLDEIEDQYREPLRATLLHCMTDLVLYESDVKILEEILKSIQIKIDCLGLG